MKKTKKLFALLLCIVMCISMVGCGADSELLTAMNEQKDIVISVTSDATITEKEPFAWVELDQLTTHSGLRTDWDNTLNTTVFDMGSKNGMLYVDLEGNWTGNNTLYNVFRNKKFIENVWKEHKIKSELAQAGLKEYGDSEDESTGIMEGINGYFNLLPSSKDGSSGLDEPITRAQALSVIYRADTPVTYLEEDEEFNAKMGENIDNIYAKEVLDLSYIKADNGGLSADNYKGFISKGEAVYMIIQRYFKDEMKNVTGKEVTFTNFKNGGDIAKKQKFVTTNKDTGETTYGHAYQAYVLEYGIQNNMVDDEMAKALCLAESKGIIDTDFNFSEPTLGINMIQYLVRAYEAIYNEQGYITNADSGANLGTHIAEVETEEEEEEEEQEIVSIGSLTSEELPDVTDTDDMLKIYGDEFDLSDEEYEEAKSVLEGFTIEECDKWMVVNSNVNVRVGPSTEFRVVSSLAYNVKVHITGRCKETGWYRIAANKKIAYVCGAYMDDIPESEWPSKPATVTVKNDSVSENSAE